MRAVAGLRHGTASARHLPAAGRLGHADGMLVRPRSITAALSPALSPSRVARRCEWTLCGALAIGSLGLFACQGPSIPPLSPPDRDGTGAWATDEFLVSLPDALSRSGLRDDLADRLGGAGLDVRHAYSDRVGLAGTLAVRGDRAALLQATADMPGLTIQPAVLRYLDGCGDSMCDSDEAARREQTTTCSIDCGVPASRESRGELRNSYGALYIGAIDAWGETRGAGVDVCVLDTGFDRGAASTHRDKPTRILGGRNIPGKDGDYAAVDAHGTHVAGLIAAPDNGVGMYGVAPDANLRIYKVFARRGGGLGATDADVVAGLDAALEDGCRIVNMSFGAAAPSAAEQRALGRAYAAGILLIAAAGNAEDAPHGAVRTADQHYPAAYREVLAVGATDPNDQIAPFSSTGAAVGISAPGVALFSTFPVGTGDRETQVSCRAAGGMDLRLAAYAPLSSSATPLNGSPLALCGYGSVSDVATCAPAGKTALIRRGPSDAGQKAVPFIEKIENARRAGATAVLLYNHRAGDAAQAGRLLENIEVGGPSPVPILALAAGDGEFLADRLRAGVDVRCDLAITPTDFAVLDGTSMAAPLVTGAAALLASRYPGLTNVALRQLLQETATDLGAPGRDDAYGAGGVRVLDALLQAAPRARCGDGRLDRTSEVCDGALTDQAYPSCDDQGYDGVAGGAVTCSSACNGLDAGGCRCLPSRTPFALNLTMLHDYRRGTATGTLAYYEVRLAGQPVRGAYARVSFRGISGASSGRVARTDTVGPSGADGNIWQFFPRSAATAGLPVGEYEVSVTIGKSGGRCRDEQTLSPFRIQLVATP